MERQGEKHLEGDNVVSDRYAPPPVTTAVDTPFPTIVGAALVFGGAIALLAQLDRKAATIVTVTMLAAIVLRRQIVTQFNDLVSTITGR